MQVKNKNELAPSTSKYVRLGRLDGESMVNRAAQKPPCRKQGPGLGSPNKAHFLIKWLGFRNHHVKQVLISWGGPCSSGCSSVRVGHRFIYNIHSIYIWYIYLPLNLTINLAINLPCHIHRSLWDPSLRNPLATAVLPAPPPERTVQKMPSFWSEPCVGSACLQQTARWRVEILGWRVIRFIDERNPKQPPGMYKTM